MVLRAAGSRAFSAGLDIKTPYGQPENIWNHEDPGEALSPKWQKMWKPVVCAVQGMCTAGAFYFINESDVVICSTDATFFDSHVSAGLVCALEPIGLMRRIGLGETLRIALMGNDERVSADTALRIGLVSEVVSPEQLWNRAHEIAAAIAAKPPSATQGTVKAIWESLDKPYRAALEQGLIYTRLGNPLGTAELAAQNNADGGVPGANRRSADGRSPAESTHRRRAGSAARRAGDRVRRSMAVLGRRLARRHGSIASLTAEHSAEPQIGMLLRNRPGQVAAFLGVLLAGGTVVTINPSRGDERTRADIAALRLPLVVGEPDDLATLVAPATADAGDFGSVGRAGGSARHSQPDPRRRPDVAVRMLTSGTTGPPKRIDLSYDMLARSVMGPDPDHAPAPTSCDAVSRS